jgi:Ser/Thr protein kinase RdoA (MazF antagonist)
MTNIVMEQNELSKLFHVYSPVEIVEAERNTAAFANDVYNLTDAEGGRFIMRILKIQDPDTVNLEANMQMRLNSAGIRTAQYLEMGDNNYVGSKDGFNFTLSKYIEGSIPSNVSPELITDFGATLARIHDCLEGLIIPPNKMQWFDHGIAQSNLDMFDSPIKPKISRLVESGSEILNLGLPEAVIHGDLWLSNAFADHDKVTAVFDFETAQNTVRIIDLARTYTSMKRETDLTQDQIIDLLIIGYNSVSSKPLTPAEENSFRLTIAYVAGVVAAWHTANATGLQDPYIEMGEEALASN